MGVPLRPKTPQPCGCWSEICPFALNVVIILKTNLLTQAQAHVILFSTDLEQDYEKIINEIQNKINKWKNG